MLFRTLERTREKKKMHSRAGEETVETGEKPHQHIDPRAEADVELEHDHKE